LNALSIVTWWGQMFYNSLSRVKIPSPPKELHETSSILRIQIQSTALYKTYFAGWAGSQVLFIPGLLYYSVLLMPVFDNCVYLFPVLSLDHFTFVQSYVNSISTTFNTEYCILTHEPDLSVSFRLNFIINIFYLQLTMKWKL
jgi:hypothetical protein